MSVELYFAQDGAKIHVHDYREGYIKWCAICDCADDDHAHQDHPFVKHPPEPVARPGCGSAVNDEYHFGVYITRVSYIMYCSRECAWKHDDAKWLEVIG